VARHLQYLFYHGTVAGRSRSARRRRVVRRVAQARALLRQAALCIRLLGSCRSFMGAHPRGSRARYSAGIPVVGLEPTCVAAFRDELLQLLPRNRNAQLLADQVVHLSEFLARTGYSPPQILGRALVHAHCHHRSLLKIDPELSLLRKAGLDVELLDAGCCGMAGDYGFRRETYALSEQLGERCLLPRARSAGEAVLVADGFSCREQVRQGAGRIAKTLAEVLRASGKIA
jgi:Fe-S oxidoreductase